MGEREQYVLINGCALNTVHITCGVPQGSILGPLLFLIYMNDFSLVYKSSFPILIADDTNMILLYTDLHTLIHNTNEEMVRVARWFQLSKLCLNIKKSNFVIFVGRGRRYVRDYVRVSVDGKKILMSHTCFLGILVDEKLNWKKNMLISFITKLWSHWGSSANYKVS